MEPKQSKRAWMRQVLESAKAPLSNRDIAAMPEAAEVFKLPAGSKLRNVISIELAGLSKSKANPIKRVKTPDGNFKYYDTNLAFDFSTVGTPDAGPKAPKAPKPKTGRKDTVRWTGEERETLAKALADVLVRDHDHIAGHEFMAMGPAIREAQMKALPETRQRLEVKPAGLSPIVKRAKRLASDRLNTLATAPAPMAAPPAPPPQAVSAPPAPAAGGLSQIIEGLVNAAVNVITERVTNNVTDQITYAMSTALMRIESRLPHGDNGHAKPEAEHEEPNLQKRRVFIIGPLPAQQGMLRHEFEKCFDLRFAEKREPVSRLKALAAGSHHVIAWLDFLPHKMTDLVKHANPQAYEQFRGGMTALRERLTQIYVNGQTH